MKRKYLITILIIAMLCVVLVAAATIPNDDWDFKNYYNIFNVKNITAEEYLNASGDKEWIRPEHIADVDKADIEGDLNTFVDIAGDNMTGNLSMDGNYICLDDPADCNAYVYYNGSGIIIQS